MSSALHVTCDRCGDPAGKDGARLTLVPYNVVRGIGTTDRHAQARDLCRSCRNDFDAWLKKAPAPRD